MVGRFAPSPTGFLHLGSLVAAMASWLDVRAHRGRWLVRIEDLDPPREVVGAADEIVATLADFGFEWDGAIVRQNQRHALYDAAFARLQAGNWVYPCACSRREIEEVGAAPSDLGNTQTAAIYPGTCRSGLAAGRIRTRPPDGTGRPRGCSRVSRGGLGPADCRHRRRRAPGG